MGDGARRAVHELGGALDVLAGADAPHPSGNDRYRIYAITARNRWQLADTTLDGIGLALRTLYEEGQTTGDGVRVGVLDREERIWLVNPWKGRGFHHV